MQVRSHLAVKGGRESLIESLRVLDHFIESFFALVYECVVFLNLGFLGLHVQVDGLSLSLQLGDLVVELSLLNSLLHNICIDLIAANFQFVNLTLE